MAKKKSGPLSGESAARLIDGRIQELGDWRGKMLGSGETYKSVVKLTFARGAALKDPSRLFNSSLEGNTRRAIDLHEGERINEGALQTLVRAAVALNKSKARR